MLNVSTGLMVRLKAKDSAAWYELWEVFGPSIERIVGSIASRYFSQETVRDVSQETLSRVYQEIAKFDPGRGVKFSTWLYAIARHVVLTELTSRNALKRNSGVKPASLAELEGFESGKDDAPPDFEAAVFRAKVLKAIKNTEASLDTLEFEAYRLKLVDSMQGKDIAGELGISEATVSRYLKRARAELRTQIAVAIAAYSFTESENAEPASAGLDKLDEEAFDQALAEVYAAAEADRRQYSVLMTTASQLKL